ncbi:cation-transporting ATPase E [Pseudonocardia hierapolitana]|uniref:Cation-transporting ATPase E n=1 Tax=Pseudonocardia hierapolitana TaxID=1128676 RepID=A0A561T011_9PSEU|nr:HAD-IC family P-type ATPase [Pseudonocardia hierapolitana]TWF80444.1 cation-transporting ATPase E [Pseudonocardia hierapolitana]
MPAPAPPLEVSPTRQATTSAPATGLTAAQVAEQHRAGATNAPVTGTSRSYAAIVRTHVLSTYTTILFSIGVVLLVLDRPADALTSVGVGLANALIGAAQECRAKRKLDRLSLLDDAAVQVLRDGAEIVVPAAEVVRGDLVRVRAGRQVVVDGPVVAGHVEADESLLTGEPDPVPRGVGETLLSGSHCVAGNGWQRADLLGARSHAGRLTMEARKLTTERTPLQRQIDSVVRLTITLTLALSGIVLGQAVLRAESFLAIVQITAVLVGLVPYGLFFLVAVAYVRGAARIAQRGALVQQVNAVESLSHVDVVCTDKTGTLTTGRLTVSEILPLGGNRCDDVRAVLGRYAASVTDANLTCTALAAAVPGDAWPLRDEIAFTSSLRWSGQVTRDGAAWVLGAPEVVAPHLRPEIDGWGIDDEVVADRANRGLRVLLLARATRRGAPLRGDDGRPALPALAPVALVVLVDELRGEVVESVRRFREKGVAITVLSGDDPRTVAALANLAGIAAGTPVAGPVLDTLDDDALDELVERTTVYGRVTPEQKERVVAALRRRGHHVAMLGDGVNDARALKRAHIGVAMRSGSPVTRDVADIVLVDDSFAALLPARTEGRRIIDGLSTSLYVFLPRLAVQALVILITTALGLAFPYTPAQGGLTALTVGIPALCLTMWARPTAPDPHLLRTLARFVAPVAVVTATFGTLVYALLHAWLPARLRAGAISAEELARFEAGTGVARSEPGFVEAAATLGAQTGMSAFTTLSSFVLLLFLKPPHRFFATWTAPVPDRRPAWLAALLAVTFLIVAAVPVLASSFGLAVVPELFAIAVPAALVWYVALAVVFRCRAADRLAGLAPRQPRRAADPVTR